jgi:DNA repair protein SbcC/Rad50
MRLISLQLESFRQHLNSHVEFRDGMTAIVGPNGSGKSTLLEAITFALYGEQRETKESIPFMFGTDRARFRVSLRFAFDGRRYEVERTDRSAHFKDLGSDKVLASGLAATKKFSERLLRLTYDQFINSFCAEQKNLAFLKFRFKTERQDEIGKMLGFDRLKQAASEARSRSRSAKGRASTLQETLGDLPTLEARLNQCEQALAQLGAKKEATQKKLHDLRTQEEPRKEAQGRALSWRKLSGEMQELRGVGQGLNAAIKIAQEAVEAAEKEVAELELLKPQEAAYDLAQKELLRLEELKRAHEQRELWLAESKRHEQEAHELELRLAKLEPPDLSKSQARIAEAVQKLAQAKQAQQRAVDGWQQAQQAMNRDLAQAQARLNEKNIKLSEAKAMLAQEKCPTCLQPWSGEFREGLVMWEQELRELREESECLELKTKDLARKPESVLLQEEAVLACEREHSAAQEADTQARSLASEVRSLREQHEGAIKRVKEAQAKAAAEPAGFDPSAYEAVARSLAELKPAHERFLRLAGAPDLLAQKKSSLELETKKRDEAKQRYRALEEQRATLGFESEEQASAAIDAYTVLRSQVEATEAEAQTIAEMLERETCALDLAKQAFDEYQLRAREIKELKIEHMHLDAVSQGMTDLRQRLNTEILPDLEARASENLNALTGGRYSSVKLDKDFEACIVDEGDYQKKVISGGEEDVLALALRLALSELIQERQGQPMSLLILDEVFSMLDQERRQHVLDRLAGLKGRFSQILVISHIEEINQVADQCIYIRRNEATRATQVTDALPLDPADVL